MFGVPASTCLKLDLIWRHHSDGQTGWIVLGRKIGRLAGLAAIALIIIAGWQVAGCVWANYELREDLRDIAAQNGTRIGLSGPETDDDVRGFVIGRAKEHAIQLEPAQVKVQRTGTAQAQALNLAVDYDEPIKLPGFSFKLHFTAEGQGRPILPVRDGR